MVAHTFRPSTQVAEAEFEASLVYREGSREAKATQTLSHKKLKDVIQLFFLIKGSGPPPRVTMGGAFLSIWWPAVRPVFTQLFQGRMVTTGSRTTGRPAVSSP